MSRIYSHIAPDREDIYKNIANEPEGERIRQELEDFLRRNNIVSILLDTEEHCIDIDIVKLPPRIKHVLTWWGSVFVRDDDERVEQEEPVQVGRKFRFRA